MFVNFSEEIRKLLKLAQNERDELNHPYIGSEHLFLAVLKDSKLISIFKNNGISYQSFKKKIIDLIGIGNKKSDFILYTPLLKKIIENIVIEAHEQKFKFINPETIVLAVLEEENSIAYNILIEMNINIDKLYFDIRRKKSIRNKKKRLLVEELGTDLNKLSKEGKNDPVVGRDSEIKSVIEILLRRKKNNPILIGPAGVGKTAIVEGVANLIANDRCPSYLKGKRLISLNIFSIVSGTKYRGEFEEKMKNIIKELEENPEIILFIDEIHTIVGAGGAEGAIDASNILKPALARGNIKVIGATTINEYKKYIEKDAALARRFQKVIINEPNKSSVIEILENIKPLYEEYHNIKISNDVIKEIVNLSDKYLTNRFEPDKSIDILDELCVKTALKNITNDNDILELKKVRASKIESINKGKYTLASKLKDKEKKLLKKINSNLKTKKQVLKEDVIDVVKNKGNIKQILLKKEDCDNLKSRLDNKIVGQEKNKNKVIKDILKKNISNIKQPYSILISGKKGSGKTYFSEILLKELNIDNIIKLDLSEYKEPHMISKLVGTTAGYSGYDNKTNIFEKIKLNASSGIIIKKYEDACTDIKQIFNKILKEGKIEDASGDIIDFTNCTIIFINSVKDEKTVGFKRQNVIDDNKPNNIITNIIMDDITNNEKEILITRKINEVVSRYNYLNLDIDSNYYKKIYNKFFTENNVKKICSFIQEDLEKVALSKILGNNLETSVKS